MKTSVASLPLAAAAPPAGLAASITSVCTRFGWRLQPKTERRHLDSAAQTSVIAILFGLSVSSGLIRPQPRHIELVVLTLATGAIGLWQALRLWPPLAKWVATVKIPGATPYLGVVCSL